MPGGDRVSTSRKGYRTSARNFKRKVIESPLKRDRRPAELYHRRSALLSLKSMEDEVTVEALVNREFRC
jgi:hypothetical protein